EKRAALNKLRNRISDERIRVKKQYLAPYDAFESRVKEIDAMISDPIRLIDSQIKAFEEAKKEAKQAEIETYYREASGEFSDLLPFGRIFSPKWLNVSVNIKSVMAEIDALVSKFGNDYRIIKAMALPCEAQMLDVYLRTLDMSAALAEKARFDEQQKRLVALEAVVKEVPTPAAPVITDTVSPPTEAAEAVEDMGILDFRVWVTQAQKSALKAFLLGNGIRYGRVE
ncbi:MAG: DUF1351 domain-containing protein, partial [Clostridia bacterium]